MHVLLLGFSVKGAQGQYIGSLASALAKITQTTLVVPEHFDSNNLTNDRIKLLKFSTSPFRLLSALKFLQIWRAFSLIRLIKSLKPMVVHLINGEGYPWAIVLAKKLNKIPLIITLHDPKPHLEDPLDWVTNFIAKYFVLPRARMIHIHSERFRPLLLKLGITNEQISVIPHGSFAHLFLPYRKDNIKKEKMALFFGRLKTYKGLDVLIEAGLILKKKGETVRIVIAGPGKLSKKFLRTIKNNPDVFELYNQYLSPSEAAPLFQRASVCVLPYRDATQSSIPSIAAAFEVPIVATSMGAFIEDVPLYGGLLVSPNNPAALAEAILRAFYCKVKNENARSWDDLAVKFVEMYQNALKLKEQKYKI